MFPFTDAECPLGLGPAYRGSHQTMPLRNKSTGSSVRVPVSRLGLACSRAGASRRDAETFAEVWAQSDG